MTRLLRTTLTLLALSALAPFASANDTTFTYQGSLKDAGAPANGDYLMAFRLYTAETDGSLIGFINAGNVNVTDGVFTVDLDFGPTDFNGSDRWLEISVSGVTLSPRQPITRTPYAIQTRGLYADENRDIGIGATDLDWDVHLYRSFLPGSHPAATMGIEWAQIFLGGGISRWLEFRAGGSLPITAGHDGAHILRDEGSKLHLSTEPIKNAAFVDPQLTLSADGLMGLGEVNPMTALHVRTSDLSLGATSMTNDDISVEAADAVLGLYSSNSGSRGSAIAMGEIIGGILVDKWGIGRNTSGSGSAMFIKYGPSPDYSANPTIMAFDTDGDVYLPNGRLGVGTSNPQRAIDVVGTIRASVVEVTGADLAERFPTTGDVSAEPGMVLEIDPLNPGSLRVSTGAYSKLVAGVVSGANGLPAGTIMGNLPGHESATPIALSGRVWVHADASTSAIRPGDLLTTAELPGHAMKVTDPSRSVGAVIGKAMSSLDRGETGMVLVIVGLQ
jgi:hypothetical protein